ncbi:MAG TPA: AgmX/PglI C-terminal domain-containing protein [Polyangiaceae bacterium]|nr:AgmX/PglI C-terminal domain-containing protein [Polyangiaceae bacterium]
MMRSLPALIALVLVGCGGSEPSAQSPAAAAPAADAPSPEPAAAPAAGKTADEGGWEGEDEAKKASGDGAATTGKPAPPDTKGEETRTLDVIAKIVKEHRQPVRDCYDKAQKELPSLKGDMVIFFVLDPEGKVKKIELNQQTSTLKAPAVVDCAIKVIKGLNFPPSSRGMETTVNHPYNFNPK